MKQILKYFLAVVLVLVIFVTAGGFIIAWYYQDEAKQLMISQVNKYVETEIEVGDLTFSVLRKFPYASVEFRDVLIRVPGDYDHTGTESAGSDTLFTAKSLFLQFKLRDLFRKEYRISAVHANNGVFNPAVNSDGMENYRFWASQTDAGKETNLDLQDVRLSNYHLIYSNGIKEMFVNADIRRIEFRGNFSQSSFGLKAFLTGDNRIFRYQGLTFGGISDISAGIDINVDKDILIIEEGSVNLSGVRLALDGTYQRGSPGHTDIRIQGYNLRAGSIIQLLPEKTRKIADPWKFSGRLDFEASIKGETGKTVSPSVFASFLAEDVEILRKDTGMRLSGVSTEGYYTNGRYHRAGSSVIAVSSFSAILGDGKIQGSGSIADLSAPDIHLNIDATFLLEELSKFYRPPNINDVAGRINTIFSIKGKLDPAAKVSIDELSKLDINGKLEIDNGKLEINEGRYIATAVEGELSLGNTIRTSGLGFNIGNDHFYLLGEIENGLPWLLGNDETMRITGGFYSRQLELDNYIRPASERIHNADENEHLLFPANLELNLDFNVDNLKFRKFRSSGFSGKLSYKPRMMVLNSVEFSSMEGHVSGNGVIVQRFNGDFMVQSQLQLQAVDMQEMFLSFNNFGQTFIHGDNLKGSLSGNLGLISEWNQDLSIMWDKLIADSRVVIKSGELIDFEPMLGLARFIDLSELRHIRFSNLQNEIFIRNEVITIPQMDINSSAFNISGSGTHRFDGHFDYRLRVLLSDVLYGKARVAKPENQQFGIVEDDGLGRTSLYLLISGTSEDYRVSYDHRAVRDVFRESIAKERNVLRNMLNEEFGWFSGDSTRINVSPAVSSDPGFRIKWDEEDVEAPAESIPERPAQTRTVLERRFEIIWDEEEKPPRK